MKLGQNIVRFIDRGTSIFYIGVVLVTSAVIAGRLLVEGEFSALLDGKETVILILHNVTSNNYKNSEVPMENGFAYDEMVPRSLPSFGSTRTANGRWSQERRVRGFKTLSLG